MTKFSLWLCNNLVSMDSWSHTSHPHNVNGNLVMTPLSLWRRNNLVSMDWWKHTSFPQKLVEFLHYNITRQYQIYKICERLNHTLFPWLPDIMFKHGMWWHYKPTFQRVTYDSSIRWQQSVGIILGLFSVSVWRQCWANISVWAHHMICYISIYIMLDHCSVITLHLLYSHTNRYFHFSQTDRQREQERETRIPDAWKQKRNTTSSSQLWPKKFIPIIQVTSLKTKNTPTII